LSEKDAANLRLKIGFVLRKLVAQMLARKFERHELVMIVCAPRRGQRPIGNSIIAAIARQIIAACTAGSANGSMSVEVQAKLQTIRMKRASPVKRTLNAKVMPFDRDTDLVDISVQRTPSVFHFAPCSLFRCATRIHFA